MLDKAVAVLTRRRRAIRAGSTNSCTRTGLPRATAHRLAVGLEVHRLLARDEDGALAAGTGARRTRRRRQRIRCSTRRRSVLPRLREITGESVQLYRREGSTRVCVASLEPPSGLRDTVLGRRPAADDGRLRGEGVAAWADPHLQRAVLADASFSERALLEVRRRGWAQSAAEREPGVASVSAPVRDSAGAVVAAVSVSGPIDRMGRRPGARWAADLLAAADALHKRRRLIRAVAPPRLKGPLTLVAHEGTPQSLWRHPKRP